MRSAGWSGAGFAAARRERERGPTHEAPREPLGGDERVREPAAGRRGGPPWQAVPSGSGPVLLPPGAGAHPPPRRTGQPDLSPRGAEGAIANFRRGLHSLGKIRSALNAVGSLLRRFMTTTP